MQECFANFVPEEQDMIDVGRVKYRPTRLARPHQRALILSIDPQVPPSLAVK